MNMRLQNDMCEKGSVSKSMPVLYRTSSPPAIYKADCLSCAYLIRAICLICTYLIPVLISIFYYFDMSQVTIDEEFPSVVQGDVIKFVAHCSSTNGDCTMVFPNGGSNYGYTLTSIPTYDKSGATTQITYRVKIEGYPNDFDITGFDVLFNYSVALHTWSRSRTTGYGTFAYSGPAPLAGVSAVGNLVLEQTEPVDFRGNLPNAEVNGFDSTMDIGTFSQIQSNLSSLYDINWITSSPSFRIPSQDTFNAELKLRVVNLDILHTLPLISIIESIILCYLSTLILCRIIFRFIQHQVFSRGLVRVWKVKNYVD